MALIQPRMPVKLAAIRAIGSRFKDGFGHTQNALMRNNVILGNWFRDLPTGLSAGKGQRDSAVLKHLADRNVYDPSVKSAAFWGGTLYKTLDEFRATTGNAMHGRAEAVDEDKLGLVSFRTRRRVERQYLVGQDEAGRDRRTEKMGGTFAYQPIVGEVTVPEWARRFRLFFGLRSCTGAALFDDIDTIRALPGKEGVVVETQPPEAQLQPLVNAGTLDFHIVDLSKVVNRELADDGAGGWSDQ